MHAPIEDHMEVAFRILKYLKGCSGKSLLYKRHGHHYVEVYTDADWVGLLTDRRSTLGYCSFVGDNLVTWRSKKQPVVARSSVGAEFKSIAHGICELLWLRILLVEVGFPTTRPMHLYCDNKTAISIAHDLVQHDRTKHVEIGHHFIKNHLKKGNICTPFRVLIN